MLLPLHYPANSHESAITDTARNKEENTYVHIIYDTKIGMLPRRTIHTYGRETMDTCSTVENRLDN